MSLAKTWLTIAVAASVLSLFYLTPPIGTFARTLLLFFGVGIIAREAYSRLVCVRSDE